MAAAYKMAVRIQIRRGTETNWTSLNPLLAEGELGVELDTGRFKIGNGLNYWNQIEYANAISKLHSLFDVSVIDPNNNDLLIYDLATDKWVSRPAILASTTVSGTVKIGSNISVADDGTISVTAPYSLITATSNILGGVKIGNGISITDNGTISFNTSTLVANAVTATTATNAAYAYSFNTSTLVANAVTATTATNAAYAYSFNTSTLVANAVNAVTATNAAYAYSFNTSTLVANAVNAVNAVTATNAAYAYSFNTSTLVANAVNAVNAVTATNAAYAYSFNTSTLVANAISTINLNGGIVTATAIIVTGTQTSTSSFSSNALYVVGGIGGNSGFNINGDGYLHGNLTVSGYITGTNVTLNILSANSATFYGDATGAGALYAGVLGFTQFPQTMAQFSGDANNYMEVNVQNVNAGNQASTDIVASSDSVTSSNGFIDMGITSSSWDGTQPDSFGNNLGPNDGYILVGANTSPGLGDLALGTLGAGTTVKIIVAGTNTNSLTAVFNTATTRSISTTTGALVVYGGVGVGGALYAGGGISGNLIGGSTGTLIYQSSTSTTAFLTVGTVGQILSVINGIPAWISTGSLTAGLATTASYALSFNTGTLVANAVSATTASFATTSGYALSFNTSTLVANAVSATTSNYATTSGYAISFNTSTLVANAVSATTASFATTSGYALSFNTGTLVANAVSAVTATTATTVAGGTAGQILFQTATGATAFISTGTAGNILVSNGTNAPTYNNTLALTSLTSATSTQTGALQVVGGVGIGGDLYIGGNSYIQKINITASSDSVAAWLYDSTATYTSTVTNQDIFFKPDGTKMFGVSPNAVFQWSLSTPWTLTPATVTSGTTYSVATVDTSVNGLTFSPDGTSMVLIGNTAVVNATFGILAGEDRAYYFTLATPWDPTSATLAGTIRFAISDQGIPNTESTPTACAYDNTGGNFYVIGTTVRRVYQYTLSTPYVVSTSTAVYSKQYITAEDTSPQGLSFNYTGSRMYILGATNDNVYEYRLSTPWDVSTAVYYDKYFIGIQNGSMLGLYLNTTATNYVFMAGSAAIYRYRTDTQALYINPETTSSDIILGGNIRIKGSANSGILVVDSTVFSFGTSGFVSYNNVLAAGQSGVTGGVFTGISTGGLNIYTGQSSGALVVGGTAATGNITIGQSTAAQAVGIASGATASASTKTVNIGTGGTAGSTTNINIGPVLGSGTTTVNNGLSFAGSSNTPLYMGASYTANVPSFINAVGTLVGTTTTNNIYAFNYQHNLAPISTATIANYYGQLFIPTLSNTATYANLYGVYARIDMSAASTSGSVSQWIGFSSENPSRNAAADVRFTSHIGFRAADPSGITATNVYGFYSQIAAGTNRYNIYAIGSAFNYFQGNVGIGSGAAGGAYKLDIGSGGAIRFQSTATVTDTTNATSTFTGALTVVGGVGIGGDLYGGGTIQAPKHVVSGSYSANDWGSTGTGLVVAASTYTNLTSSGTVATSYINAFGIPTIVSTTATTITGAATVYIAGVPIAGTNTTISNAYSLRVQGGTANFGAAVQAANFTIQGTGGLGTSNQLVVPIVNTYATTVNFAGSATTVTVGATTGTTTFNSTTTSISTTTGAVQIRGGVGVADSVYVGNRVGFVNTSNVSVVYQYYNATTNSLDTVFG